MVWFGDAEDGFTVVLRVSRLLFPWMSEEVRMCCMVVIHLLLHCADSQSHLIAACLPTKAQEDVLALCDALPPKQATTQNEVA